MESAGNPPEAPFVIAGARKIPEALTRVLGATVSEKIIILLSPWSSVKFQPPGTKAQSRQSSCYIARRVLVLRELAHQ
jgi:hypothetical protein